MAFNPLDHRIPGQFEYRGVVYGEVNKGVDLDILKWWTPNPSDVLIASYPKTGELFHHCDIYMRWAKQKGTTWLSGILPLILHDGDEEKVIAMGHMVMNVPYVEMNLPGVPSAREMMGNLTPPRVIKTHLRYEFFKKNIEEDEMKVIVPLRNPKDTITSFYHFYKINKVLGEFTGTFHEFFELVKAKQLHYGDLFDWYKDWWTKRNRENTLTLKYEDLIKDSVGEVRKIAEFCNKDLDETTISKIVESCSISKMKVKPTTNLDGGPINTEKGSLYRKGGIGDWKNHFNEEESEWVEKQC